MIIHSTPSNINGWNPNILPNQRIRRIKTEEEAKVVAVVLGTYAARMF